MPAIGETVIGWDYHEPVDGGKGSNQAIAAARLGARVSFVGCVGQDRIGREGARWLRQAGVDTSHLIVSNATASGVGFILLHDSGVPAMVTAMGANAELAQSDVESALQELGGAKILLTQFEIRPEVALYAARVARQLGMLTIVNPAPAPSSGFPLANLDTIDVLTPNETEAKALLGMDPEQESDAESMASQLLAQTGARCVIVTMGAAGVWGDDGKHKWRATPPAVNVVDTSGAGDAFCAALAVGLAREQTIQSAAAWACAVAAYSVTRPGTIPAYPTASELEEFDGLRAN